MVLNDEVYTVELTYADQTVKLTETATSFFNDRQKVKVNLEKWLETNEAFDIGTNEEIKNISFGLFAEKEIVSASGTSIPAGGLIEIITLDEKGNGYVNSAVTMSKSFQRTSIIFSAIKNIRLFLNTRVKRRVRLS